MPPPFAPAARPSPAVSAAPAPLSYAAQPEPQRGMSTGCLLALFVGGGFGIGLAGVLALMVVFGAYYATQM